MPINILSAGSTGTHTFTKTTVNIDEDYIYFNNPTNVTPGSPLSTLIPNAITDGTGFIYRSGVGSLGGVDSEDLYFAKRVDVNTVQLSLTSGGDAVDISSVDPGTITFNTPAVFDNKLNIDASTPTNQAFKYFTNGSPIVGLQSGQTYFLKNVSVSDFAGSQALYVLASNTHTFTTCGQTGRVGPTQAQMRAAYSTTWDEVYLSQGDFQGYQDWTVPVSGIYEFTARGASGFNGNGNGGVGRGAIVRGRTSLTKGEIITIAVGQVGAGPNSGSTWGGSGGGSFVVRKSVSQPLFIAGGGSAESNTSAGRDGVLTQLGGSSQTNATAGFPASFGGFAGSGRSGGGGGFRSRGESVFGQQGGGSFFDGLTMTTNSRIGGFGGFGGLRIVSRILIASSRFFLYAMFILIYIL